MIEICIVEWSILFRSKGSQTRRAQGFKKRERDWPSSLILDKHSPCQRGSLTRHKIRKRRVTFEYVKADRHANGSRYRAIDLRRWSNRNIVRLSLIVRQSPIVRQGREGSKNSTTCRSIRIITVRIATVNWDIVQLSTREPKTFYGGPLIGSDRD